MKWPQLNPNLNLIENIWSIVKMKLYVADKQNKINANIREVIKTFMSEIE